MITVDHTYNAKELRRATETLLGGIMPPEIASCYEKELTGLLKRFYAAGGKLGHSGYEKQLRHNGFDKMGR